MHKSTLSVIPCPWSDPLALTKLLDRVEVHICGGELDLPWNEYLAFATGSAFTSGYDQGFADGHAGRTQRTYEEIGRLIRNREQGALRLEVRISVTKWR
jgi:hypothetical protein